MRTGGGDAGAGAAAASRASAAATASALDATFFGLLRGDCGEAGGLRGTVASQWPASGGARSSTMTKPCSMSYFKSLRAAPIARYCPAVVAVVHRSKFSLRRLRVRAIGAFLAMRLSTSSSGGNVAGGRGGWSMCADAQTHAASTNTNFETLANKVSCVRVSGRHSTVSNVQASVLSPRMKSLLARPGRRLNTCPKYPPPKVSRPPYCFYELKIIICKAANLEARNIKYYIPKIKKTRKLSLLKVYATAGARPAAVLY